MSNLELIKKLREETGAGMTDCQKALAEAKNDFDKAIEILRKNGQKIALNKQGRTMREGVIDAYIHANKKIGVLVEVSCETDFVARTQGFRDFVHDVAMQVAAANPQWLSPEDVPAEIIAREKDIYSEELKKETMITDDEEYARIAAAIEQETARIKIARRHYTKKGINLE